MWFEIPVRLAWTSLPLRMDPILPVFAVVACMIIAAVIIVADGLRRYVTSGTLAAFLGIQFVLVFVFAQSFIYCGFIESSWNTGKAAERALTAAATGDQGFFEYLRDADSEQLYGISSAFRRADYNVQLDSMTVMIANAQYIDGLCERKNLGGALYLSVITWTSVGYGDLVPAPWARIFAAAESILGYLFMAAFAALLIRWMRQSAPRTGGSSVNADC